MPRSNEKVELELTVHHRTEKALLVTLLGGPKRDAVWIPKSQVEFVVGSEDDDSIVINLPEWLAIDKELV